MIEFIKVEKDIYSNYCKEFTNLPISLNPEFNRLQKEFGFTCSFYIITENGNCIGLLPTYQRKNKHYSVPFFSYGMYLDLELTAVKLANIKRLLSTHFNYYSIKAISTYKCSITPDKITAFLPLKNNIDDQMGSFNSKLRSQIRKGYKNGIKSVVGGVELIDSFYSVYSRNMHDLGSPPYSKTFFYKVLNNIPHNQSKVFLISLGDVLIGASICISYNSFTEVVWASTLRKYNYLSSNMVLYWEMISFSISDKQQIFSFGRSDEASTQLKFKKQWGVETSSIIYLNSENNLIRLSILKKYFSNVWKLLPYKIASLLGPIISEKIY